MAALHKAGSVSGGSENKFVLHERMASAIVEQTRKHGGCLPQDLLLHGFTKQETIDLWHMANAMAEVELKLQTNQEFLENKVKRHA